MKKKYIFNSIFTGLLLMIIQPVFSQSYGLKMDVSNPGKELGENLDHTPAGITLQVLFPAMENLTHGRLLAGGELGVAMYTGETYEYEYSPGETVEVFEEDCFFKYHAVVQYLLRPSGAVVPFVEGRMGFTSFFSNRLSNKDDSAYDGESSMHGTAFNTGLGGGIYIDVFRLFGDSGPSVVIFSSSVHLLSGTKAHYRDMANVERSSDLDEGIFSSRTNMVNFSFGLHVNFMQLKD